MPTISCAAALFLTSRAKEALIGESTDPETIQRIEEITLTLPQVVEVGTPFTMRLGPNDLLVGLDVHFHPYLSADQVARAVDDIEDAVREVEPAVTRIFVEPQRRDEDLEHPEDDVPEMHAASTESE